LVFCFRSDILMATHWEYSQRLTSYWFNPLQRISGMKPSGSCFRRGFWCTANGRKTSACGTHFSRTNLLSRALRRGGFREHTVHIQGTFSAHSGNIQGPFRDRFSRTNLLSRALRRGGFREHSVHIQGTFSAHSGNIQGTFREHSRNIQGLSGHNSVQISENTQRTFREHSVQTDAQAHGCQQPSSRWRVRAVGLM
jgi:hypothetical protein